MTQPRYRYRHQQERKRWAPIVAAGDGWCAEPKCLMPTRWIDPRTPWHLLHDTTGTIWTGVGHRKCNTSEGAIRGNKLRAIKRRRWAL